VKEVLIAIIAAAVPAGALIFSVYKYNVERKSRIRKEEELVDAEKRLEEKRQELDSREKELSAERDKNTELMSNINFVERLLDLRSFSLIRDAVQEIFEATHADRFLMLVAPEKVGMVSHVTVIFEQHKGVGMVSAIARYRNLAIDDHYRDMLALSEKYGNVHMRVKEMPESLLKNIYLSEKIERSKVRFILRKKVSDKTDILVFSSTASHKDQEFSPEHQLVIQTIYDSTIIPRMKQIMGELGEDVVVDDI